ncbi:MAG: stage 0 sporulation family protein [Oscillospiraceae bacterium]|nr:stage 0 sporulation family protein [Oscillospiraceae bacterium]
MEELTTLPLEDVEVVDIQFRPGQKIYFFDPDGKQYRPGDHVIIDTARGAEYGTCTGGNHTIPPKDVVAPLRKVLRLATAQDERIVAENRAKEKKAFDVCIQKIADHKLDMQLVSAEVAFDGSKILFYFTADERVDFRELVKNLASVFHTRIELRQIGVRDKAKMVGGLGICGRPFCCASFLDDFQPVSIKMAKTQNLSLNPTKISGTCGRLMCCLKYEQDAYEDLIRTSPKLESFVDTPEGRGTVVEVDLLRQRVKVRMEDAPETISLFSNTDIAVLRSGKAKKNDPPIPADLAPISGSGKRVRREAPEERGFLEPIKFRYSTEKIVEEPEESVFEEVPAQETGEAKPSRSRRRRKDRASAPKESQPKAEAAPKQEKPKAEPAPKQEKPRKEPKEKPAAEAAAAAPEAEGDPEKKSSHRRRGNYHHRRRKKPAGDPQA